MLKNHLFYVLMITSFSACACLPPLEKEAEERIKQEEREGLKELYFEYPGSHPIALEELNKEIKIEE